MGLESDGSTGLGPGRETSPEPGQHPCEKGIPKMELQHDCPTVSNFRPLFLFILMSSANEQMMTP